MRSSDGIYVCFGIAFLALVTLIASIVDGDWGTAAWAAGTFTFFAFFFVMGVIR